MKKASKYIVKAICGVLFAVAAPFALICAGLYWLIELLNKTIEDAD